MVAFFRSVVVMAPKLKPIGELGFVEQKRCGEWRAVASVCGHQVRGPSRSQESAAQADLQVARSVSTRADMAAVLNRLKTEAANMSAPHAAVAEEQAREIRKLRTANEALMQNNEDLKTDVERLGIELQDKNVLMQDNQSLKKDKERLEIELQNRNEQLEERSSKIKKMKTENQSLREKLVEADSKRGLISVLPSFRKDVIAAAPDARGHFAETTQSSAVCRPPLNQREASLLVVASSADGASTDRAVPERPLETEPFHRDVHLARSGSAPDDSVPSGSASNTEPFQRGVFPKPLAKRNPERIPRASDIAMCRIPRVSQPLSRTR